MAERLSSPLVSTEVAVGVVRCEVCGQSCTEVDAGRDWTHLEVTREQPFDGGHWLSADFCTQAHAAEWLGQPLPERGTDEAVPAPTTWADRAAMAGCFSVAAGLAGLIGLGAWTALRFAVDLF